jgi:PIN domain nuclease of toxin-antitoxin system
VILLDTHVVAWLYQGPEQHLTLGVRERLRREQLGVSPVSQLELQYMFELGRTRGPAEQVIRELGGRLGLSVVDISATVLCREALELRWTRDPFDRLLAAHALAQGLTLVTKDHILRRHLPLAWWAE